MSYSSEQQALDNAVRLMQEGGAMMVKLEGGVGQIGIVENLARHDIPVCAHIGLKPQSVHKIGGFKVQGRNADKARQMVEDAVALESAGADIVLLECVPNELGKAVTEAVIVDDPVVETNSRAAESDLISQVPVDGACTTVTSSRVSPNIHTGGSKP